MNSGRQSREELKRSICGCKDVNVGRKGGMGRRKKREGGWVDKKCVENGFKNISPNQEVCPSTPCFPSQLHNSNRRLLHRACPLHHHPRYQG